MRRDKRGTPMALFGMLLAVKKSSHNAEMTPKSLRGESVLRLPCLFV